MVDDRNLLCDYTMSQHPLLKDFPCEGVEEVYYNFFTQQTNYVAVEFVEL